jgi:hypothetical protein
MVCAADKREFEPALASYGLDNAEWEPERVQNRALFDVKLKVTQSITAHSSLGNFAGT